MKNIWKRSVTPTLLVTLLVAGCQTTTPIGAIDKGICSIFPPITYSSQDTAETIMQVRRHNAGRDAYCGN